MQAYSVQLDVAANNVANANTPAYKTQATSFSTLGGGYPPGQGVAVSGVTGDFSQGPLARTDVPTDVAIQGNGFFRVEQPDGSVAYTRSGNFTVDGSGFLRSDSGGYVLGTVGRLQLSADSSNVSIDRDGLVSVTDANGNAVNVGSVSLAIFNNPQGLKALGGENLVPTQASGAPNVVTPGQGGGSLLSGTLEMSNVDFVTEMISMIVSRYGFKANAKALETSAEMLKTVTDLKTS